jgi:hypothetical protein
VSGFETADKDRSGSLDLDECQLLVKEVLTQELRALTLALNHQAGKGQVRQLSRTINIHAIMNHLYVFMSFGCCTYFNQAEIDADNRVLKIKSMLEHTKGLTLRLFAFVDHDGSNKVTLEEFKKGYVGGAQCVLFQNRCGPGLVFCHELSWNAFFT